MYRFVFIDLYFYLLRWMWDKYSKVHFYPSISKDELVSLRDFESWKDIFQLALIGKVILITLSGATCFTKCSWKQRQQKEFKRLQL